jgi:hypothetical protein
MPALSPHDEARRVACQADPTEFPVVEVPAAEFDAILDGYAPIHRWMLPRIDARDNLIDWDQQRVLLRAADAIDQ